MMAKKAPIPVTNTAPTRKQIETFVKLRNKSPHASNLQFEFDAAACGFKAANLGAVVREPWPNTTRPANDFDYVWQLPYGTLREHCGVLSFIPHSITGGDFGRKQRGEYKARGRKS